MEISAGMAAPHRVVDTGFGPWMMREPHGAAEEAMAPGAAARRADREWRTREPLTAGRAVEPLRVDEVVYQHGHTREVLALAEVQARYGPVRPVEPPPAADVDRLRELIAAAGARALGTLAAALYAVEQRIGADEPPSMPESGPIPAGSLIRADPLTAGRPGSWEAGDLIDIVWTVGPTIGGERLDEDLYREAAEVFHRWATGPAYVEFAETIPAVLASRIEEHGVVSVADSHLLAQERIRSWAASKASADG